ncbi:hypothetical protein [Devosia faecipullorum]|nr:hypothetical protein [Devosia faecipullorum]MBE7733961.1 hypothetical protein [Devosia faecipullorum]
MNLVIKVSSARNVIPAQAGIHIRIYPRQPGLRPVPRLDFGLRRNDPVVG